MPSGLRAVLSPLQVGQHGTAWGQRATLTRSQAMSEWHGTQLAGASRAREQLVGWGPPAGRGGGWGRA